MLDFDAYLIEQDAQLVLYGIKQLYDTVKFFDMKYMLVVLKDTNPIRKYIYSIYLVYSIC